MTKVIVTETPACGEAEFVSSTPRPWRISPIHDLGNYMNDGAVVLSHPSEDEGSQAVAHVLLQVKAKRGNAWQQADPVRDANAALIVKAVNSFQPLVTALRELLELCDADASFENRDIEPYKYDAIVNDVMGQARAALKLAQGE